MTAKRILCLVAALLLVPAIAAADDLSATLTGGGGAGLASIVTGSGTVSYAIFTNGIGTITGAEIRQGNSTFVNLNPAGGSASAAGSVATGANLATLNANPGNFSVRVTGTGGTISGPLANAGAGDPGEPTEEPGTLAVAQADYTALERDGEVTVMVTRTGGTDGAVSVAYATGDGTATAGDDYTAAAGTLNWADGDGAPKMVVIDVTDDAAAEDAESFTFNLSNPTGDAALGAATATVTILDNDTPCVEDANTLCLNDGRFEVTSAYDATNIDQSGDGTAIPLPGREDTGLFWFFNQANVEIVVKVLNGCAVNNHYWVFAGGLTNVQVDLQVRDTESGLIALYENPANTAFQPIQDTEAFATCP